MLHRLVVLSSVLCLDAGLGCSSKISGGNRGPVPDLGAQDPDAVAEHCFNGVDDDGDFAIDCWDPDCTSFASCGGGLPEIGDDAGGVEDPAFSGDAGPAPEPQPLACGNGILEAGEECDDGNLVSSDGCDGWCEAEPEEADEVDEGAVEDVTSGQSVDASLDPVGDDDWYRILLADGDRLTVETSDGAGSCEVDTILQLFGATRPDPLPVSTSCEDETDDVMCDDDGGEGMCSVLDHTATADGFVHVRVLAYGGDGTGDYRATFTVSPAADVDAPDEPEPDDWSGDATAIADGDVVEGEIDPATDEDYFTLEVRAFEIVRLETSDGEGGCNFDSVLTLYDGLEEPSEGTSCLDDFDAFACDDDEGIGRCSLLESFIWLDGTVLARVTSFGHLSTGAYSLSVSIQ